LKLQVTIMDIEKTSDLAPGLKARVWKREELDADIRGNRFYAEVVYQSPLGFRIPIVTLRELHTHAWLLEHAIPVWDLSTASGGPERQADRFEIGPRLALDAAFNVEKYVIEHSQRIGALRHYIYGGGPAGEDERVPPHVHSVHPHLTWDYRCAVEELAKSFKLGWFRKRRLRRKGLVEVGYPGHEVQYCAILECHCPYPENHDQGPDLQGW